MRTIVKELDLLEIWVEKRSEKNYKKSSQTLLAKALTIDKMHRSKQIVKR
jgi:hypothetical protein